MRFSYDVVTWTNHYRWIDGELYRDAIARRSDGELRVVAYRDDDGLIGQ